MKPVDSKYFFVSILLLLSVAKCTPEKRKDLIETKANDTTTTSLYGKVVFRIKNSTFFINSMKKRINSIEDFSEYVPVNFYEKGGEFFIPNRLDNVIYKINSAGSITEKITVPVETDIAHFYIADTGEKYILNRGGLVVFDRENKKLSENPKVIFINPDFSNDNLLITSRFGDQDEMTPLEDKILEFSDIRKVIKEPITEESQFSDKYLEGNFLYEMSGRLGLISFKSYDLQTLKMISQDSTPLKCKHCFDMDVLLAERLVVASNFSVPERDFNELFLFNEDGYKSFELIPPIKETPLNDINYIGRMPLSFCFSLSKDKKKLYSLATTEKEVVVMEYDIP